MFAYSSSRDTKVQAELMSHQVEALREQNKMIRDQFEVSIRPAFNVFTAPQPSRTGSSSLQFDIVVKNMGGSMAKNVVADVKTTSGNHAGYATSPVLQVDADLRIPMRYDPTHQESWTVSVHSKDRLDREQPLVEFVVSWPPTHPGNI